MKLHFFGLEKKKVNIAPNFWSVFANGPEDLG